ncbi:hypothetical protein K466DRAFT_103333 [Polyporus arcularius HHB13444]|uniref:Uncharacterized protein n=1 Tax=Polyporus arcularius HHB13444 TaxID=1314778 RepID=A0A5C3PD63_9APHY|nr:hypothetical protein K466DRAFT_103333 [Polyporus arcularius HHB13444]
MRAPTPTNGRTPSRPRSVFVPPRHLTRRLTVRSHPGRKTRWVDTRANHLRPVTLGRTFVGSPLTGATAGVTAVSESNETSDFSFDTCQSSERIFRGPSSRNRRPPPAESITSL